MSAQASVVLVAGSGDAFRAAETALAQNGVRAVRLGEGDALSTGVAGLLLVDGEERGFGRAVADAIGRDLPVLGIGDGMHALNAALGGMPPATIGGHVAMDGAPAWRQQVFLSPGGKVAHAIGGSGWVSIVCSHSRGVRSAGVAPVLLASAYASDGVVEAIERPGRQWVVGVQWPAHMPQALPGGFENPFLAFVDRACGA